MAQTGYTPIQLYYSSTTTNAPVAGNLASGELAINITDGKLFYKDNSNVIQVIGWKIRPANAGGTGQTSFAIGDLLYADTTSTLAKLADVATGNALISGGVSTAPSWGKIGLTTHVSGTLPTANGGTNLTSFTANGVLYASSTSALATSSSFVFDGTSVGIGISTPQSVLEVKSATSTQITVGAGTTFSYAIGRETTFGYLRFYGNQTTAVGYIFTGVDGESMRIDASKNLLVGTTTSVGISTNTALVVGGKFITASGTVSATTAVATTIFTCPTLTTGLYLVNVQLASNDPAIYGAVSLIGVGNTTLRATALALGSNMTITISGQNIQATQTSGSTNTITWTVTRLS